MLIAVTLVRRARSRLLHIALAGSVKWAAAIGLAAYLRAHGHRPIWAAVIGAAATVIILLSALWPAGEVPPVQGPPPA
ncbi:MAG: hypothetical protein L6Q35_03680 [Phycisphaerales bacterium]|nr:hypothetical protein [Phycisphaerales bacterium]